MVLKSLDDLKTGDRHWDFWLEGSSNFCGTVGLSEETIANIYVSDTDWAFLLKIDALLETASKTVLAESVLVKVGKKIGPSDGIKSLIGNMPINGRVSVIKGLQAIGVPQYFCDFIETVRVLRNIYAHKITMVDMKLIDVIDGRQDRRNVLKRLAPLDEEANLNEWENMISNDPGILRYGIMGYALNFLAVAYHVALAKPDGN